MRQLIESARSNGVRHLYSIALSDNAAMRALAEDLGMIATRDASDLQQTIYSLAL
jgi:L-amino acid N-acyltransferase YncA